MKKVKYPRLVTYGGKYRIEIEDGEFQCYTPILSVLPYIWETDDIERAREELERVADRIARRDPKNWKPV